MEFRKLPLMALVAVAFTFNCVNALAASTLFAAKELQLNDSLPSEADFERSFEDPLPALVEDDDGKHLIQLANCRDYLAVRSHIIGSSNDRDYRVLLLQTIPCVAFALLKSAAIASRTALPKDFLRYTSTINYPASLWPVVSDDERQRLEQSGATLRTVTQKADLRKVNNETLEVEKTGFGLHLTLLARGDFDHDKWEDAAFRWEGYALNGSYSDARLVILTRTNANSRFREIPLEQLLPKP